MKAEEKVREHCNIEYSKTTGEEIVKSSLASVTIAVEEFSKAQLIEFIKDTEGVEYVIRLNEREAEKFIDDFIEHGNTKG